MKKKNFFLATLLLLGFGLLELVGVVALLLFQEGIIVMGYFQPLCSS
jgi:hypothetical protein